MDGKDEGVDERAESVSVCERRAGGNQRGEKGGLERAGEVRGPWRDDEWWTGARVRGRQARWLDLARRGDQGG